MNCLNTLHILTNLIPSRLCEAGRYYLSSSLQIRKLSHRESWIEYRKPGFLNHYKLLFHPVQPLATLSTSMSSDFEIAII